MYPYDLFFVFEQLEKGYKNFNAMKALTTSEEWRRYEKIIIAPIFPSDQRTCLKSNDRISIKKFMFDMKINIIWIIWSIQDGSFLFDRVYSSFQLS